MAAEGAETEASDSQEDDLAVDVWSEGEGRGKGLLTEQTVALLPQRLLHVLADLLLLPRRERLDVYELRASTQRIHPPDGAAPRYGPTPGLQATALREERREESELYNKVQ